jgi:hypothetical protein
LVGHTGFREAPLRDGTPAAGWKLADSKLATTGVFIATYEPAGEIKKGSFAE